MSKSKYSTLESSSNDSNENQPLIYDPLDPSPILNHHSFILECKTIFKLALPISTSYLLQMSIGLASVFSLGHVGTNELAASALATMYCNVTGFSLAIGMASALDTLCSQAFTGSNDPHALGKHLQRGIVVMFFLCFPVALVWTFSEQIFLFLGQDPIISKIAGEFTLYMIIGLFPYFVNECLKRYLQAQGLMMPNLWVTLLASPINMFLQYLLVWSPYAIGANGAPIATSITYTIIPIFTILYIRFIQGSEAWGGWSFNEAFNWKEIWTIFKLGIPGTIMICSEWWAFEIVALLAGLLGNDVLAAQSIVLNTTALAYMLPLGVSVAVSTRIGNNLGANLPNASKVASRVSVLLAFFIAIFNCSILIAIKSTWGYVWTHDENVIHIVSEILPLAALFQFSDALGAIGGGVLRGCGRQRVGALINICGYYVLGLPFGVLMAFKFGLGLVGLWLGLTSGLFAVSIVLLIIIFRVDWKIEAEKALVLVNGESDQILD